MGYKEKFFTTRVVRQWHRLAREVVGVLSWKYPRPGDGALSTDGAVGVPVHCREAGLDGL